jgi:hypothetical protein
VHSVLSAIPIYMLTAIKPPKQILQDLDKIRRHFLWVGDGEITRGNAKWVAICGHANLGWRARDFGP